MLTEDERNDLRLLSLANDNKHKFAIPMKSVLDPQTQAAFERGIDGHWFDLVDISVVSAMPQAGFCKIFRLTQRGLHVRNFLTMKDKQANE